MNIDVTTLRLACERPLNLRDAPVLRSSFGEKFAEQELLHHHRQDGSLIYDYPRIQFKVIDRQAVLIGLEEGSTLLARLWLETDEAKLGSEILDVREATIRRRQVLFGQAEYMVTYRFLSPWLALNQENARRYYAEERGDARTELLGRILVGNCLSIAKSFRYTVTMHLRADCSRLRTVHTRLKGVSMLGFVGEFRVSFRLPDLWGIGKSVSRGFGTVSRVKTGEAASLVSA